MTIGEEIIKTLPKLLKGVRNAMAIEEGMVFSCFSLSDKIAIPTDSIESWCDFFSNKKEACWFKKDELPFDDNVKELKQNTLLDEANRNILYLRINQDNELYHTLIWLDGLAVVNGFAPTGIALNEQSKIIAEQLLFSALKLIVNQLDKRSGKTAKTNDYIRFIGKSVDSLQLENEELKQLHKKNSRNLFLIQLKQQFPHADDFAIDGECLDFMISQQRDYVFWIKCLQDISYIPLPCDENNRILVSKKELAWAIEQRVQHVPAARSESGRYSRTKQLLDRYETAASKAVAAGLKVTGVNIGRFCDPAVSNASITDALKKQKDRVLELLHQYPAEWPIIRGKFKSIQNLAEKHNQLRYSA